MRLPSAGEAGRCVRAPGEDGIVGLPRDPSVGGERLVDRGREVGERERDAGPAACSRRSNGRAPSGGSARNFDDRVGLLGREHAHAGRDDLGEHRVGIRHARAAVRDRLDRPGCRSPPTSTGTRRGRTAAYASAAVDARPSVTGSVGAFDDALEHRRVAVLGRARDPEPEVELGRERVQLLREPQRAGNVLALDRARRLEQHEVVVGEAELLRASRRGRRAADRGRSSCGS